MYALLRAVETTTKVVLNMADVFMIYIMYVRNIRAKLIISELVSVLICSTERTVRVDLLI